MKLLFVHERFGAFGGAETNLHLTARELKNRGHEVSLLHGHPTGQQEEAWRQVFPNSQAFPLTDKQAVRHAVTEFQPDLAYVHKMPDLDIIEALVSSGLPLVRMVHDHDLCCMRSYKYNTLTRAICRRAASSYCLFGCGASVARNRGRGLPIKWISYSDKLKEIRLNQQFDRLIVATHYMKNELVQNGFEKDKIEIHAPVPQKAPSELRSSFSAQNLVLYVGQIIRGKGVDVLLESLARVQVPFECLILGEGNHRPFCEKLSRRLGLGDRVHFLGFVPQEELQRYFCEASLVALSSVWPEPFGAAGLEGMRYGLPVVAF